jgi:hypothetical protein
MTHLSLQLWEGWSRTIKSSRKAWATQQALSQKMKEKINSKNKLKSLKYKQWLFVLNLKHKGKEWKTNLQILQHEEPQMGPQLSWTVSFLKTQVH